MPKWAAVRAWISAHRWMLLVAAVALLADRASKVWALSVLPGQPVELAKYFWLSYVENTGAAFGMFQNANALLVGVMLAVIGYIIFSWKDLARQGRCSEWGAVLILAGALGNLYDRLTLGSVIDFIKLEFVRFAIFNVADVCICAGAALVLLAAWRSERGKGRTHGEV